MKTREKILLVTVLILFAGMAATLAWLRTHQKLGTPAIKGTPNPGSVVMNIDLPADVLGFTSTNIPQAAVVTNFLPRDTSYAQRRYTAPDGFWVNGNVILMGTDRTSIHKPEYCLPGQGWQITEKTTLDVPIGGAQPYQLRVAKWSMHTVWETQSGTKQPISGIYVFWFIADNQQTTSHSERLRWLARDLLRRGVLQRWAYISYFAVCVPGQEEMAFQRMKELIAASVPEFQLPPEAATHLAAAETK